MTMKWKCQIHNRVDLIRENVAVENWQRIGPEFLLDVAEKWLSQEIRNYVKEKHIEVISEETLVCRVVVESLVVRIWKC